MRYQVMQELRDDAVLARDGHIGAVKDVYFDDERWAVRYLVVDTGGWLPGREVLISPASVDREGSSREAIQLDLTREQVEQAPGADQHAPVSRMYEEAHARHYGYPFYWAGPYLWGPAPLPAAINPVPPAVGAAFERDQTAGEMEARALQSHLRSSKEVVGYHIRAADGDIGHVEDFVVDDDTWAIAAMLVDTRNWLPGKKVLVPPSAIQGVDWHSREVAVSLTKDELRHG